MAISAILNLILNLHTCARKKANCLYASLTFYNCNEPHINDALLSYETADTVFSPKMFLIKHPHLRDWSRSAHYYYDKMR